MRTLFKRVLKVLLFIIVFIVVAFLVIYLMYNKPLPQGEMGPEAETMAQRLLEKIDKPAWDSTRWVHWTFRGDNTYIWDKQRHWVKASWGDCVVRFDPSTLTGEVYQNGHLMDGKVKKHLIQLAYKNFTNDAFWLNAPSMVMQSGVERRVVELEDGAKGLLITYKTGGVTPGDSYLWEFDEEGLPKRWSMWVGVIPIGGVSTTWQDWQTLKTGAKVATQHESALLNIPISNLKAGMTVADIGLNEDPFEGMVWE